VAVAKQLGFDFFSEMLRAARPASPRPTPSTDASRTPTAPIPPRSAEEALAAQLARRDAAQRRVEELARLSGRLVDAAKEDDPLSRRGQPPTEPLSRRGQPPTEPLSRRGQPPTEPLSRRGQPPTAPLSRRGQPPTDPPALRLAQRLALGLGQPVRLTVTDNRRTMLSARRGEGVIEVRLHRMFLDADDTFVETLVRYLGRRERDAGEAIEAFIAANRTLITKPRERRTVLRTRGAHHDLRAIFDALLPLFTESFDGVHITWGRLTRRKRGQRGLQLGTYTPAEKLVRIHPVLDQAWVPQYVVATVVHHEMLHHALPAVEANGKTFFHTPEFRRREAAYPDHLRTEAWERTHLPALLRSMPR
jgi:hypothetical protein